MEIDSFVAGMPKAELHIHIEGSLEPDLVRSLARRNNISLDANPSSSAPRYANGYDFDDLPSFLAIYYSNMTVLQTSLDFFDLAWAYLTKCHVQNILHAEIFFDPQAHTSRGVPFSVVVGGLRQAIVKADRELGVSASLIMCFLRDMDAGYAMATLMEALPYKEWIVGVGLDSDEKGNPPSKFADVFRRARQEGFLLTMHCDIDQENSIEHIRQVIRDICVDRIDHGTNVVEDEELVELLRQRKIPLTCCPISNSVISRDFKGKEIVDLLRRGVRTTVNSDDPAYFGGYLNENMMKMARDMHLKRDELVQLQRNAFNGSWLSSFKRDRFLNLLEQYAAANT